MKLILYFFDDDHSIYSSPNDDISFIRKILSINVSKSFFLLVLTTKIARMTELFSSFLEPLPLTESDMMMKLT